MRAKGKIQKWDDERGFGFIKPEPGNQELFFHITSFRNRGTRPNIGMEVNFELGEDAQGRKQAKNVEVIGSKKTHQAVNAFMVAALFLSIVGLLSGLGYIHKVILWLYVATSLWLFMLYLLDKSAAEKGRRRIPEATLHNFALIGGWPGALFAQQLLRHKSKKETFRRIFWFTVFLNVSALAYLLSPYGAWITRGISGFMG